MAASFVDELVVVGSEETGQQQTDIQFGLHLGESLQIDFEHAHAAAARLDDLLVLVEDEVADALADAALLELEGGDELAAAEEGGQVLDGEPQREDVPAEVPAEDLALLVRQQVGRLLDRLLQELLVVLRVDPRHQDLHLVVHQLVLLRVPEHAARTQVALRYQTQSVLLARDIHARRTVCCVG